MGEKSFFKPIGAAGDRRIRFRPRTGRGKVTDFLVQLELEVEGGWKPVVRYDNAHDFAHRDILDPEGLLIEKKAIPQDGQAAMNAVEKAATQRDIAEAFSFAKFVLKHPAMLKKIRDGSNIRLVPAANARPGRQSRRAKNTQTFVLETTFRGL